MTKQSNQVIFDKVLVTGGYGTVGSYVREVFKNSTVMLTGHKTMDITKLKIVKDTVEKFKPNVILHLAAITNVDLCEKNEELAMRVNYEGTANIAEVCKIFDIPLLYISTSSVFDGKKSKYNLETDHTYPSNIYAKTKLLGEKEITNKLKNFLIIRAGWMIGGGKKDKKFISYIIDKIKSGETVYAVNDKFGTITYAKDLLNFAKEKLIKSEFGLFHYGSKGICSRYDIACLVRDMLNKSTKIIPVSSEKFNNIFSAPRPKYEVIGSSRISFQKNWNAVIKDYVNNEII